MISILYASYFNTAILLLLCNANFSAYPILRILPLKGQFADTSTNWYILIGPALINTMLILSIFPYINFIIFYGIRVAKRFYDSGIQCCKSKHGTKLTTVQQYVDLYSGPEMLMFFKYSNIMNMVFVSMTHGAALPVLFPITLFGIINNYLAERTFLAYYYK